METQLEMDVDENDENIRTSPPSIDLSFGELAADFAENNDIFAPPTFMKKDTLETLLEEYDDETKIKMLRSYANYLSTKVKALQGVAHKRRKMNQFEEEN